MREPAHVVMIPPPLPNTFDGLMEVYEDNYRKIRKLCDNINPNVGQYLSVSTADLDLHMQIIERSRYTYTLILSYHFNRDQTTAPADYPQLTVRVYHDAMQAEVLPEITQGSDSSAQYENKCLLRRWRDNRFLSKWLSFLLRRGHSFD